MKFKINEDGKLEIWRKNKYVIQECPFKNYCSDKCSLFSEPEKLVDKHIKLSLCRKTIYSDNFIDERK